MAGGRASDGVGRARFVAVGVVVAGVGRVVVVVGGTVVIGGAVVIEVGGIVVRGGAVVVVVGGAMVVDVMVTVDGSAVTGTVLGLTVEVSEGIAVTGTVDSGTDATPGSCGGVA
ncbi:hypothetical protein [Nocardia ignorata]|uniref:hypothetical protein n=1 Tax=Nocardia ignorata TaxID=145285 RepID=UPI00082ADAF2|nr:hypothetical protein [Nocardia ignorata]